jgi:hypothetical protein
MILPVRVLRSISVVVFIASAQDAFADQHWWTLARGTDFKIFDKCLTADRISSPQEAARIALGRRFTLIRTLSIFSMS